MNTPKDLNWYQKMPQKNVGITAVNYHNRLDKYVPTMISKKKKIKLSAFCSKGLPRHSPRASNIFNQKKKVIKKFN